MSLPRRLLSACSAVGLLASALSALLAVIDRGLLAGPWFPVLVIGAFLVTPPGLVMAGLDDRGAGLRTFASRLRAVATAIPPWVRLSASAAFLAGLLLSVSHFDTSFGDSPQSAGGRSPAAPAGILLMIYAAAFALAEAARRRQIRERRREDRC